MTRGLRRLPHAVASTSSISSTSWRTPRTLPNAVYQKGAILSLRGWAFINEDPTRGKGVCVRIDDGPPLEALAGLDRRDVAQAFHTVGFAASGFRGVFSTAHLALGDHILSLAVRSDDGRLIEAADAESFSIDASPEHLVFAGTASASMPGWVDHLSVDGQPAVEPITAQACNTITIRGRAVDPAGSVEAVFAVVSSTVARGVFVLLHDDVAAAADQGAERYRKTGFTVEVPLASVPPGEHALRLRFVGAAATTVYEGPVIRVNLAARRDDAPFVLTGEMTKAHIDEASVLAADGTARPHSRPLRLTRGDQLLVSGWAVDAAGGTTAAAVHLWLDDLPTSSSVLYGLARSDVAAALGNPEFTACGFNALISTASMPAGMHELALLVLDRAGRCMYETSQHVDFTLAETP